MDTISRIEGNRDLMTLKAGDDQKLNVVVCETFGGLSELRRVSRKEYLALKEKEAVGTLFQVTLANRKF